jgi:amino acid transporter
MFAISPRYLAALGRADAFGSWLGREDRRRVPQWALWLTAAGVLALVQLRRGEELFVLSSVAVLAQYAVSAAALVRLSLRGDHGLRAIHLVPAPLALGAILLVGQAARLGELAVATSALMIGALLLLARRVTLRETVERPR